MKYQIVSSYPEVSGEEYDIANKVLNWINESKIYNTDLDLGTDLEFVPTIPDDESGSILPSKEALPKSDAIKLPKKDVRGKSTLEYTPSKGESSFEEAYISAVGEKDEYYDFLKRVAKYESGFNPMAKNPGAPAYGYFQFMQDGVKWDNISRFAGVDIETFKRSPELQILAARKLYDSFNSSFTSSDWAKAKELGLTKDQVIAGAWLAGAGGVKNYLHRGKNVDDKHWNNGAGIDLLTQFKRFAKNGGILKAQHGVLLDTYSDPYNPTHKISQYYDKDEVLKRFSNVYSGKDSTLEDRSSGWFIPDIGDATRVVNWEGIDLTGDRGYNGSYIDYIYNRLLDYGYDSDTSAIIIGNIMDESGGDPYARHGEFKGLLQWADDRYQIKDFNDSYNEIDNQLEYLHNTIDNIYDQVSWTHGGENSGYQRGYNARDQFKHNSDLYKRHHAFSFGYVRPYKEYQDKLAATNNRFKVVEQVLHRIR